MSGESPLNDAIEFTAKRDGVDTRHAIDIVFDDFAEVIEARMFWFNPATQAWARNFAVQTKVLVVPSAVVKKGGPEAMCQFLVNFYNTILAQLFPAQDAPDPVKPWPDAQDPDGLSARTRELFLQYRVVNEGGALKLVK